jgi:hypothetical protein
VDNSEQFADLERLGIVFSLLSHYRINFTVRAINCEEQ